ncbi:tumor protein p53-inducible protein 13 isoform X2 [Antennarius striatus]|uniref:tumor protein p53-inducible protein 13 isoform X2 n=1 Tax=Antennarius striatus TaxID=241820 RepID=UPI0035B1B690
MPNQAASATLLLALWTAVGRGGPPPGPGCDNGKLFLDRDLPHVTHWECPTSPWPAQRRPGVDTVYRPQPVQQVCMDRVLSYDQPLPNSGAYRPIRAQSGEYLYCPPQRWINNLHHAATVLLFHPCAPVRERRLLALLGHSCLSNYVLTPHPQLGPHQPIALVSWARTLELSTVAVSDTCDWLETTTPSNWSGGVAPGEAYDFLLIRPVAPEAAANRKSVRRCCQEVINMEARTRPIREGQPNRTLSRTLDASTAPPPGNETALQADAHNTDRHRPLGSDALRIPSAGGVPDPDAGDVRAGPPTRRSDEAVWAGPPTRRSDEAVWAAAALGFLLVLLTLSVLHTRLYRHWRTAPSLYWRDPRLDYDSVADVIRRRLRIAKRRRRRRQECVLLPSSSSSDDPP